ncbi:MAG: acetylglutamate kinase [Deltaproteobacteria bacterium]|nr:acetylglutamate kinase [Deltaproteobacteria bacterium]
MHGLAHRRILVKVGGETVKVAADRERLARDVAAVVRMGAKVAIVHGAGPQITALAERLGIASVMHGGRRVTDAAMLRAVAMAMCGEVATDLMGALLGAGVDALPLPAAAAGIVVGRKRPPRAVPGEAEPVDFGWVADVDRVRAQPVEALWASGLLPVLSSLVADASGKLLNLNADTLVTALVPALRIEEVVLVTGVPGVFRNLEDPRTHLPYLQDTELPGLIRSGAVQGGMVAKLEEVGRILHQGAERVAIVGYQDEGALTGAVTDAPGMRTLVQRSAA